MQVADVAIAGAGPAGTATAIALARAGRSVVVLEKASVPRDKTCGDGLTVAALRRLQELGLDPAVVHAGTPTTAVTIRAPSGRTRHLHLPDRGAFSVAVPRLVLDAALVELARDAGATILAGHEVTGVTATAGAIAVSTKEQPPLLCRYLVAADGAWSPVRRHLGLTPPGYRGDALAFRRYASGLDGPAATELFVSFEPDLLPGFFWSFPLGGGRANTGFGAHLGRRPGRIAGALWDELVERPHIRAALGPGARPDEPVRGWPLPTRLPGLPLSALGGRVLFVGDAAGATDPLSGEGIAQALGGGALAATSIRDAGPHGPQQAAETYEGTLRRTLARDHAMARAVAKLLSTPGGADLAVALPGLSPGAGRLFVRWLFEDEPRGALLTPRRWHRRFLGRDGAFA